MWTVEFLFVSEFDVHGGHDVGVGVGGETAVVFGQLIVGDVYEF